MMAHGIRFTITVSSNTVADILHLSADYGPDLHGEQRFLIKELDLFILGVMHFPNLNSPSSRTI